MSGTSRSAEARWVGEATGIIVSPEPGHADVDVRELVGLALRDNPRRAFLLVSTVLGKHVPVPPSRARAAARRLADQVRGRLDGQQPGVVVGFAETATGLGHAVADELGAGYLHSTRRAGARADLVRFDEQHSHARGHALVPADPGLLTGDGPVVVVDDELSTGRTALNLVAALQSLHKRERYVVAALVDVRSDTDCSRLDLEAGALGVEVDWVALGRGSLHVPSDAAERAAAARDRLAPRHAATREEAGLVNRVSVDWPPGVREGGRHGITAAGSLALDAAAAGVARRVLDAVGPGEHTRLLVLGTEELMHAPMRVAAHLELAGVPAWYSSTTRSPAVVVADPGYPLRDVVSFPAHDAGAHTGIEPAARYAYNVAGGGWSDVVLVVDSPGDTPVLWAPGGLVERLAATCPAVWVVVLPVAS